MNISEEKTYLYSMMQEITQERRKLTDIYFSLKERVDELNSIESKGLSELNIEGYVDAFNKNNLQVVKNNLRRETERIIEDMEQRPQPAQESLAPKEDIAIAKDREPQAKVKEIPLEKVSGIIAHALKERGTPMSIADLYECVSEQTGGLVKKSNFRNNILPRTLKTNKNINRATRGYYQYIHN